MNRTRHPSTPAACTWCVVFGAVLALAGVGFVAGGAVLVSRGGSPYYVAMGAALAATGVLLALRRPAALGVYLVAFAATGVWAVWEAGLDFWPLHARLFSFAGLLLLLLLVQPALRRRAGRAPRTGWHAGAAAVVSLGLAVTVWQMFLPHGVHRTTLATGQVKAPVGAPARSWAHYGNGPGGDRFGAFDQIHRGNVAQLEVAWRYRTGDVPESADGNGAEDQLTPLQVGDRVFLCTPHNNVIALDADTGAEKWKRVIDAHAKVWMRCRGLAYFDAAAPLAQPTAASAAPVPAAAVAPGAPCQRRLLMNTITAELVALDADTGAFCPDFGQGGRVSLKEGLGDAPDPLYAQTSAPTLAGTTVVVGGRVADNVAMDMPGGVVRGFDVVTGRLRWAFDPGRPERREAPPPGETYTRSSPNVWAAMSYDPATNTVFMPVGSAAIDLWGAQRRPTDLRYGASLLALDATTGQERWVYQTVRNDLWDYDVPMQPTFFDFRRPDGRTVPALVFGTKAGQLYVLDRATGRPLTRVEEKAVKPAGIPGERYPSQPVSTGMPQIGAGTLTEADMWGATPVDQLLCRIIFRGMRYEGLYTAPSTDVSLSYPGSLGGMNWGGLSLDPTTNTVFVNDMRLGLWVQMIAQANAGPGGSGGESVNTGMGAVPLKGTPYSVVKNRFLSPAGVPCQEPPFGTLTAIDLDTQQVAWEVPLGTVRDSVLHGVKMRLPMPVGMPTIGGSLATQGGLVFFAATQDFYLRAFDSGSGRELWKGRLPVGSQGTPITYQSPKTGRQYVVISAGGARQSPERGDHVVAYALPR